MNATCRWPFRCLPRECYGNARAAPWPCEARPSSRGRVQRASFASGISAPTEILNPKPRSRMPSWWCTALGDESGDDALPTSSWSQNSRKERSDTFDSIDDLEAPGWDQLDSPLELPNWDPPAGQASARNVGADVDVGADAPPTFAESFEELHTLLLDEGAPLHERYRAMSLLSSPSSVDNSPPGSWGGTSISPNRWNLRADVAAALTQGDGAIVPAAGNKRRATVSGGNLWGTRLPSDEDVYGGAAPRSHTP